MANKIDMKLALESKLRRLESLENKGFFTKTYGDVRKAKELQDEIKKIEDALVSGDEQ